MRIRTLALASLAGLMAPSLTEASPWTLPAGQLVMSAGFDVQFADAEFLEEGGEQSFPLEGRLFGAGVNLGIRYGISDRFEIEGRFPVRFISFQAEPVILRAAPLNLSGAQALAFYQRNVVDFSQSGGGVADISLAGRYRLLFGVIASSLELRLDTPTGYREPEGTFGRQPTTVEAFEAAAADLVRPENVRDDVVLGDGRLALTASLLVGTAFSTGTFVRGGLGYALRLGGAGDQLRADMKVGQALGEHVLIFVSAQAQLTVESGELIGVSVVATDPERASTSFIDGNTRLLPRPLERDALDVSGGLVWRLTQDVELDLGYQRTVWGRFTAATQVFSFAVVYRAVD